MKRIYLFWLSLLTFIGGMINAQAVVAISMPVSHFTGNITYIALNFIEDEKKIMGLMLIAFVVFFIGALFSGYFLYGKKVKHTKAYSNYLFINSVIFALLTLIPNKNIIFFYCAFYLGMQNGMLFIYKGVLTRTTHITGYLTDSGVSMGLALKGEKGELALGIFYIFNMFVFAVGCVFGVVSYNNLGLKSLYVTSVVIFSAGLWYRLKIYKNKSLLGNLQ